MKASIREPACPLVFRIRNPDLRRRFEQFVAAESKRTGYRLSTTEVAERAIDQFLKNFKS